MTSSLPAMQPASLSPIGLPARIVARFRLWRKRRRWIGEMADAAAFGQLDGILADVGLNHAELGFLMDGPADAGREFGIFAQMQGVDVKRLPPDVVREAVHACAHCASRVPCKRWLRTGTWKYDGDSRCPNAALFYH